MTISHTIPGRIRLRHTLPLSATALGELTALVRSVAPSAELQHSPQTCGTLVLFKEVAKSAEVVALLKERETPSQKPVHQIRPAHHRHRRHGHNINPLGGWPKMGSIKRGMAASLAASLLLVALDRERGHAMLGGLFLGLLSRHLWVYRKRLWQ